MHVCVYLCAGIVLQSSIYKNGLVEALVTNILYEVVKCDGP